MAEQNSQRLRTRWFRRTKRLAFIPLWVALILLCQRLGNPGLSFTILVCTLFFSVSALSMAGTKVAIIDDKLVGAGFWGGSPRVDLCQLRAVRYRWYHSHGRGGFDLGVFVIEDRAGNRMSLATHWWGRGQKHELFRLIHAYVGRSIDGVADLKTLSELRRAAGEG